MRWLADESVAAPLVNALRALGHDVLHVTEVEAGLSDVDVINLAAREKRILLTEDKDFGELVFRRKQNAAGLILLRLGSENSALKLVRLEKVVERYGEELSERYVVIEDRRFRSRHLWLDGS